MPENGASWKEIIAACVCFGAAWIVWGTLLIKMVRRFRLTGGRATAVCFAATLLLAVCIWYPIMAFQAQTTGPAQPPRWLVWLILGLIMGHGGAYMTRLRQQTVRTESK
jgi:hypothetical protein